MVVSSAVSVAQPSPEVTPGSAYDCDTTESNGLMPAGTPYSNPADWYGSGPADPSLWLYAVPNGPISPYPEFEPRDQGGHRIKTPFWRSEGSGPIMLTGERLDATSEHDPHVEGAWGSYPKSSLPRLPFPVLAAGRSPAPQATSRSRSLCDLKLSRLRTRDSPTTCANAERRRSGNQDWGLPSLSFVDHTPA